MSIRSKLYKGSLWSVSSQGLTQLVQFSLSLVFCGSAYGVIALKKVHIMNIYKTLISVLLLAFGFFGIRYYGLNGMAWVYMVMTLLYIVTIKLVLSRMLGVRIYDFLKNTKHIVYYGVLVAAAGFAVYFFVPDSVMLGKFGQVLFLVILCLVIGAVSIAMMLSSKILKSRKPFFDVDGIIYLSDGVSNVK